MNCMNGETNGRMYLENSCYRSVLNVGCSVCYILCICIYSNIMFSVALCGLETWSVTLGAISRLKGLGQ